MRTRRWPFEQLDSHICLVTQDPALNHPMASHHTRIQSSLPPYMIWPLLTSLTLDLHVTINLASVCLSPLQRAPLVCLFIYLLTTLLSPTKEHTINIYLNLLPFIGFDPC